MAEDFPLHGGEVRVWGSRTNGDQPGDGALAPTYLYLIAVVQASLDLRETVTQVSNCENFHNVTHFSITLSAVTLPSASWPRRNEFSDF